MNRHPYNIGTSRLDSFMAIFFAVVLGFNAITIITIALMSYHVI